MSIADTDNSDPADVPVSTGRKRRRTWPQRALLTLNIVVILACFVAAIGLVVARNYGNSLVRVDIETPTAAPPPGTTLVTASTASNEPGDTVTVDTEAVSTAPPETFPTGDAEAKNFLITGADNDACIDPNSPYAGGVGDRTGIGERSDTIMVMRVDPSTNQGAVLSFPRDLWVDLAGGGEGRINKAYVKDDAQRLIDTIFQEFGVPIHYFLQIDFSAFKAIVDAVGGVSVPFDYPARDRHTGLDVPETGCYEFDGDHALAYVRSRHYEHLNADGKWVQDPAADLGRISRQQDFLRRALTAALHKGLTNPAVAKDLIEGVRHYVVFGDLTLRTMLEFAGVLRNVDPGGIRMYQIETEPRTIAGNSVLMPLTDGDNMQAILRVFRGEAPLAGAPIQAFESTTTSSTIPTTTTTVRPSSTTTTATATSTTVEDTVPAITSPSPEENTKGFVPPDDPC